jgi:hypothetical protein
VLEENKIPRITEIFENQENYKKKHCKEKYKNSKNYKNQRNNKSQKNNKNNRNEINNGNVTVQSSQNGQVHNSQVHNSQLQSNQESPICNTSLLENSLENETDRIICDEILRDEYPEQSGFLHQSDYLEQSESPDHAQLPPTPKMNENGYVIGEEMVEEEASGRVMSGGGQIMNEHRMYDANVHVDARYKLECTRQLGPSLLPDSREPSLKRTRQSFTSIKSVQK